MSDYIKKDHLLGVRCFCIIGIIFSHSYNLGIYETGHLWRIPTLFLLGGAALIKPRPLLLTFKYVFKSFYVYIVVWSAIYLSVLYFVFDGVSPNRFVNSFDKFSLVYDDILYHNSHRNTLILSSWFLLPYALGLLIVGSILKIVDNKACLFLVSASFLVATFSLIPANGMEWSNRVIAHALLASGLMIIGVLILKSRTLADLLQNGWIIVTTFGLALWLSSAFEPFYVTWSWLNREGYYWLTLPSLILFLPIVFWVGKHISQYKLVKYIGRNSKHIMVHHLFGFLAVNIILVSMGIVRIEELHPLYIKNGSFLWPIYFFTALIWSLVAGVLSDQCARIVTKVINGDKLHSMWYIISMWLRGCSARLLGSTFRVRQRPDH